MIFHLSMLLLDLNIELKKCLCRIFFVCFETIKLILFRFKTKASKQRAQTMCLISKKPILIASERTGCQKSNRTPLRPAG